MAGQGEEGLNVQIKNELLVCDGGSFSLVASYLYLLLNTNTECV